MSVKAIKRWIKSYPIGLYLTERYKKKKYERWAKTIADREFIERTFRRKNHGLELDLDDPQTLCDKLQWLKLYYRDDRMTICSDKAEIKRYLREQGYGELAVPTIALYERTADMDVDALPEQFMLKASHGSGWNMICRDKKQVHWGMMKRVFDVWLSQTLDIYGREWNYQGQTPRMMIEPLLDDKPLIDYKFMCFNGVARAVQVNHTVDGNEYIDLYDEQWHLLEEASVGYFEHYGQPLPKPMRFEEMRGIAEQLAAPFSFVRVDMYAIRDRIYVGEMTFFPSAGFLPIFPLERDRQFGEWLELPEKNYG